MGIKARLRREYIKRKGRIIYPSIVKRSDNPVPLTMTSEEADRILRSVSENESKDSCFKGVVSEIGENLYDVSVVIPVYNGEAYLKECLDSILGQQTEYSFEVICVNDGSKDSSLEILESYSEDEKVKLINQENSGISAARNKGISQAKGRYILLVDNDDMLATSALQKLMDAANKYQAEIVKSGHRILSPRRQFDVIDSSFYNTDSGLGKNLLTYNGFIWGTLIKREVFTCFNLPVGYWYEDMVTRLLLYRMCKRFVYLDQALYLYRMHGNNASRKVWSATNYKALDQFYLCREILEYSQEIDLQFDIWTYAICLNEFGKYLYERTIHLDLNCRKAVFKKSSDLMKRLSEGLSLKGLGKYDLLIHKALVNADFELWEDVCKYYFY